ncbi:nardilysin-like isoform X2 [Hemicordylus capensis]|uniref:nardilysin-like isoform X2 n=1 Tax=Hemicordylus capensis TaxID=884348 RepID=UPI0023049BE0|nr:nardilysin-like isoform X2 [Hemicordylus capensis]
MSENARSTNDMRCPLIQLWQRSQEQARSHKSLHDFSRNKRNVGDPEIIKSPSDHKEYRYIQLKNEMNVLLISDLAMDDSGSSDESEDDMSSEEDEEENLPRKKESSNEEEDEKDGDGEGFGDSGNVEDVVDYGGEIGSDGTIEDLEKDLGSDGIVEDDAVEPGGTHVTKPELLEKLVKKEDARKMGSTEKQSAAALAVCVGSFSDPDDLPGLAHFLEHMVFMGSQKYPDENGFDTFLKKHGGADNASTDTEKTIFQFDIQKKYFKEALDRWAQFFIHPLMIKDAINREVEAVDSEYQIARPSDANRRELLLGSLAKAGHPMRKFFWGNAETLKHLPAKNKIDTYARLRAFRQRYYSAHYMNLVIQSRETLDTLEKWVNEIFSEIPNNGLPRPTFENFMMPFDTPEFHRLYKVIPVKEIHSLSISWALPPQDNHYRVKPLQYISWLIGHEGRGSVLSLLRKQFWALALYGGNSETGFEHNSTYSIFSISVTLTNEGLAHFYEVTHLIFQYLKMLQKQGPIQRVWGEIEKIEANEFCFQEQTDPIEFVENICENMHIFKKEDFLIGDQLLIEYNPAIIADALSYLIPQTANLFLLSPVHEGKCPLKEKWFGTKYSVSDIDEYWSNLWNGDFILHPDLHLPEENKYIATDFSIKESDGKDHEYPEKILSTQQGCLWYKKDNKFGVPKAFICFHLVSPLIQQSAMNLAEPAYQADVAQLEYKVIAREHGLVIRARGFNHKLPLLFQLIIDRLSDFTFTPSVFQMITEHLKKTYFNFLLKPDMLAKDIRLSILEYGRWSLIEKYETLTRGLSIESVMAFATAFKSNLWIEGLVQGNVTIKESQDFLDYIVEKLKVRPLIHPCPTQFRVTDLPNTHILCKVKSLHKGDANSNVTVYYQSGARNLREYTLMELLVMQMEEPCFDYLRTKQTLGYHVYPSTRNTSGILGFSVTVTTQASKYNTELVDRKIEDFLIYFEEKLRHLTDEEFSAQVSALIKLKQTDDAQLAEEVDRNWNEVLSQQYMFDRLAREIVALKTFRKSDLVNWFLSHRHKDKKVMSTHVVGYGKQEGDVEVMLASTIQESLFGKTPELTFLPSSPVSNFPSIMDIRAFTSTLNILPFHKIQK